MLNPQSSILAPLFFVFYFGELCVHHVAFVSLCFGLSATLCLGLFGGVHLLAQFLRGGGQCFGLRVDGILVVALHHAFGILQCGFDGGLFIGRQLLAVFLHRLVGGVDQRVQLVARGHQFHGLLVLVGVRL